MKKFTKAICAIVLTIAMVVPSLKMNNEAGITNASSRAYPAYSGYSSGIRMINGHKYMVYYYQGKVIKKVHQGDCPNFRCGPDLD